jgi:hypothetical protein
MRAQGGLMTAAVTHYSPVCSDGKVRRFYAPTNEMFDDTYQFGFVYHNELKVKGYIIPHRDGVAKHRFICTLNPSPIPLTVVNGWVRPANCCALLYCERCMRCVGGCKK